MGLNIKMLGEFSIWYGKQPVIPQNGRQSRASLLLQYLLINHDKAIPQEELIRVILDDEACDNSHIILKNLVYRLRKVFQAVIPSEEFIHYKRGAYVFHSTLTCALDVEEFANLVARAEKEKDTAQCVSLCIQAVNCYSGDFLPKASSEPWVMALALRYQKQFCWCALKAYDILETEQEYEKALAILKRALEFYRYEEALQLKYITCLFKMKRVQEALQAYEDATNMMFDEFGIQPSEEMRAVYYEIASEMQTMTDSILDIRKSMEEVTREPGPFYCNFTMFTNMYRYMVRHMERSGQSVFLMLCSFRGKLEEGVEGSDRLRQVCEAFSAAAAKSLRRSDSYTRYSPTQFLLMLLGTDQENCHRIAERLIANFKREFNGRGVSIHYTVLSSLNVENLGMNADLRWKK